MSLFPCSACGVRKPGKYASVTMAWFAPNNDRVAYRLKVCDACYVSMLLPLYAGEWNGTDLKCPSCGESTEQDMAPTYATIFIPGQGKLQLELPMCGGHATELRAWAIDGGSELLPQVGGQDPGPQAGIGAQDTWSSLGRDWREHA